MIVKEVLERLIQETTRMLDSSIVDSLNGDLEGSLSKLKEIYTMLKPVFEEQTPATESPDE